MEKIYSATTKICTKNISIFTIWQPSARIDTECEGMINVICIQTILKLHKTLGDTFIGHPASILALSWKTNPLIGFQM